jgi:RNA polymerase sporulation-specific sigma factor
MTEETIECLRSARAGDREAAERMVTENSGLIWSVARRFFGRGVDSEDLYQLGCVGFLKAIEGYDESFGTQFSTYAVPKISGEIRRFLRDDGAVKVSRSVKERAAAIKKARERLTGDFGRDPTVSELSEALGLSPEEIAAAETATSATESIQRQTGEEGFSLEDVLCTDGMEEKLLERMALQEALARLNDKERLVIQLRYYHSLTQQRVAGLIGVSQVQVSRIEKKALERLRTFF